MTHLDWLMSHEPDMNIHFILLQLDDPVDSWPAELFE